MSDELYPFRSRFMDVQGHRVHYLDEGHGPTHLFLAGMWSFTYRHYIAPLRERVRCVAIDYPGFGLSTGPATFEATLPSIARIVHEVVQRLDLRDVTLWANDAGGPIGMSIAARDPDRFRAFILGGTFAWPLDDDAKVRRMLGIVGSGPFRFLNRQLNLFPKLLGGPALGTRTLSDRERDHYVMPLADRRARDRPLLLLKSLRDESEYLRETAAGLARLRAKPALLAFGEKDRSIHFLERWKRELPDHEVVLLPGVDHFPFEDDPEAVMDAVRAWLPTSQRAPLR